MSDLKETIEALHEALQWAHARMLCCGYVLEVDRGGEFLFELVVEDILALHPSPREGAVREGHFNT